MKTPALLLHSIRYSDSASIVRCFTRSQGLASVFARHRKKGPQLLSHAFYEITADKKPGSDLYSLKELNYLQELNPEIPNANATLWLLANELILKTSAENIALPELFDLLSRLRSMLSLPQSERQFLPVLLMGISDRLGILHTPDIPALDQQQRELLALLGVEADSGNGSAGALLEHLQQHFDIGHVYAADLLLQ